ncbi:MAG: hypothetical protein DMG42_16365 [Acidobacteria bacterium]|nr:MAG: hypothetical protein DMG42_16365 [Acidobacteriota bacterium]
MGPGRIETDDCANAEPANRARSVSGNPEILRSDGCSSALNLLPLHPGTSQPRAGVLSPQKNK